MSKKKKDEYKNIKKYLFAAFMTCALSMPVFAANPNAFRDDAKSKERSSLTEEEAAAGYQIIGGHIYSPEELRGQSGDSPTDALSSISGDEDTSQVTFAADVPEDVVTPYVVTFANADTYQEYSIALYPSNNYTETVHIPVGSYYFTSGGPASDYVSRYKVTEPVSFTVTTSTRQSVNLKIRSKAQQAQEAMSGAEKEKPVETTPVVVQKPQEEKNTNMVMAIAGLLLILGGIFAIIVFVKYKQFMEEDE